MLEESIETCRGRYDEEIELWVCPRDHCEQCRFRNWVGRTHDEIMQLEEQTDE